MNSPGTGEFPAQMASNGENVSIWWCHHDVTRWRDMTCLWWKRCGYTSGSNKSIRYIIMMKLLNESDRKRTKVTNFKFVTFRRFWTPRHLMQSMITLLSLWQPCLTSQMLNDYQDYDGIRGNFKNTFMKDTNLNSHLMESYQAHTYLFGTQIGNKSISKVNRSPPI